MSWWSRLLKSFDNVVFMFFAQDSRSDLQIVFEIRINQVIFWVVLTRVDVYFEEMNDREWRVFMYY